MNLPRTSIEQPLSQAPDWLPGLRNSREEGNPFYGNFYSERLMWKLNTISC
jgi:hypothetical protein